MNNIIEERSNSFFDDINDIDLKMPNLDDFEPHRSDAYYSDQSKELSFYALDVENVEELVKKEKVKDTNQVTSLRIMHCN